MYDEMGMKEYQEKERGRYFYICSLEENVIFSCGECF